MATEKPRYTVSVDDELFKRIEDFRFAGRYGTRSQATVELIRRGLEAIEMDADGEDDIESLRQQLEAAREAARAVTQNDDSNGQDA